MGLYIGQTFLVEKKQKQTRKEERYKFKYLFNKVKDKFLSLSEADKKQTKRHLQCI